MVFILLLVFASTRCFYMSLFNYFIELSGNTCITITHVLNDLSKKISLDQFPWQNDIEASLSRAKTYEEWKMVALSLDYMEGNEKWKSNNECDEYEALTIQNKINVLMNMSLNHTMLKEYLQNNISRNIGNISNPKLYTHTYIGSKHLIESYSNHVCEGLEALASDRSLWKSDEERIFFFKEVRKNYGNTALLLSGGGSMGLHHLGVFESLYQEKLLPNIISGTSSGAIVAALICCKTNAEYDSYFQLAPNVNLTLLEEPLPSDCWFIFIRKIYRKLRRIVTQGVVFDSDILRTCIRDNIGDMTFLEAFKKTGKILNVSVSSGTGFEVPRMLNYITCPNMVIWSAVVASCALPNMFQSGVLMEKSKSGEINSWTFTDETWVDGSVENDLPIKQLGSMFGVNYFIVSQVNPHVVPFLPTMNRPNWLGSIFRKTLQILKSELLFRLPVLIDIGICPKLLQILLSILKQTYEGDVTIVPELISLSDILTSFASPTRSRIKSSMERGSRASWSKLEMIREGLKIESKLDSIIQRLSREMYVKQFDIGTKKGEIRVQDDILLHKYSSGAGPNGPHHYRRVSESHSSYMTPNAYLIHKNDPSQEKLSDILDKESEISNIYTLPVVSE